MLVLSVGFLGKLLVSPITVPDLMAAQAPPQHPAPGEWAVLLAVSAVTAFAVVGSAGRRRPGRGPALFLLTALLLGLCAVVALWVRGRVGSDGWTLGATLESLAAGVTALALRGAVRRAERGRPLPGEVWLAMVPFREDDRRARHYCVVVARRRGHAEVLQITSQDKEGRRDHVWMPNDGWDPASGKEHWVERGVAPRRVPYADFLKARPQGPCPRATWRLVRRRRRVLPARRRMVAGRR
ncbi:hypothetical protein [Streptomyces sp. DH12]|uniref:hypothetical protein n=1 Tax=Streptomyces sp. DH12 TaxID=2857010 RepID=UPI001E372989|nr:hypothetical protein [Streptomyces sp. DH12]